MRGVERTRGSLVQPQVQEQRIGTLIWRGKWIIAICLVLSIVIAIAFTTLSSKVYEAAAIFQINSPGASPGEATDLANQGLAKNYATLIVSPGFLDEIKGKVAGGAFSAQDLESKITAEAVAQTGLMQLKVRGDSPAEARRIANQIAIGFVASLQRDAAARTRVRQRELESEIRDQGARLQTLTSQGAGTPGTDTQIATLRDALVALRRQSASLVASGFAQGGSASLAAAPTASPTAVSPRPSLNLLAGIVLGALAGIGIVLLRERLRPALHSAEDAAKLLGVSVLTSIPLRRRPKAGDPILTEAYEMLRAQLSLAAESDRIKVVTIGSYSPGEGKTSVVEGTAYSAVRGGRNVLVIDGDLRMSSLSKRLGQVDGPDVTDLIEGTATQEQAIRNLAPGLDVLPSVSTPSNPPAILNSSAMRHLLADLETRYDLLIIDSPPLAHLADASILASLSDGFVLVVRAGVSKPADLVAAQAVVRQADSSIMGVVVFEARTIDKTYYPSVATPHDMTEGVGASS